MKSHKKPNIFEIDLNRKREVQQPSKALSTISSDVFCGTLTPLIPDAKSLVALSTSCFNFYKNADELNKRILQQLLQAVMDDDQDKAKSLLLHARPERLLFLFTKEPAKIGIEEINSISKQTNTILRFKTKKLFIFAQMLKRLEMINLLLPYFDKLKEHRFEKKEQWLLSKPPSELQKKLMQDYYIEKTFLPLIIKIANDNEVYVECNKNDEIMLYKEGRVMKMNKATSLAIEDFKKPLLPQAAIDFDNNYVEMEQFLLAACQAYTLNFNRFQNWDQRNAYSICIVGFIISLLGPRDQQCFWLWLNHFTNEFPYMELCERGAYALVVATKLSQIKENEFREITKQIFPSEEIRVKHSCVIS